MAVTLRNAVSLAALLVIGCADDPSGVVLADAMAIDAASFDAPSAADSPDGSAVHSGLPKRSLDPASYNDWQAPTSTTRRRRPPTGASS